MNTPEYLIGIDPSLSTAGVAIYQPSSGAMSLFTGDLFSCVSFLNNSGVLQKAIVVCEDPNKDSTTFGSWSFFAKKLDVFLSGQRRSSKAISVAQYEKAVTLGDLKSEFSISMNHAQKVGMSKASAKVFVALFEMQGIEVLRIAPSSRSRADKDLKKLASAGIKVLSMPTKTTSEQFKQLTGFEGRSSEHARDAATLVHGRSISWAQRAILIQTETERKV